MAVFFCSSLTALCLLHDRLCFGFVISISEMLNVTRSKYRVGTVHGKPGKSWNFTISFSRPGKS